MKTWKRKTFHGKICNIKIIQRSNIKYLCISIKYVELCKAIHDIVSTEYSYARSISIHVSALAVQSRDFYESRDMARPTVYRRDYYGTRRSLLPNKARKAQGGNILGLLKFLFLEELRGLRLSRELSRTPKSELRDAT